MWSITNMKFIFELVITYDTLFRSWRYYAPWPKVLVNQFFMESKKVRKASINKELLLSKEFHIGPCYYFVCNKCTHALSSFTRFRHSYFQKLISAFSLGLQQKTGCYWNSSWNLKAPPSQTKQKSCLRYFFDIIADHISQSRCWRSLVQYIF